MENMNVDAFIEKFAENVWTEVVEGVDRFQCAYPAAEANRSILGFYAAFRIVFGREPTEIELDHLKLNFLERFTQLLDGYTLYINAQIKEKLNNE